MRTFIFVCAAVLGVLVMAIGISYQGVQLWVERRPRLNPHNGSPHNGSTQRRVDHRRQLIDG